MANDSYPLFDYPNTHFLARMSSYYLPTAAQFVATLTPSTTTAFMRDPHSAHEYISYPV